MPLCTQAEKEWPSNLHNYNIDINNNSDTYSAVYVPTFYISLIAGKMHKTTVFQQWEINHRFKVNKKF